jgi:hypothetical protein
MDNNKLQILEIANENEINEMLNAFNEIQMPRSAYVLENMVVKSEDTEAHGYAHCVLEMQNAYDNLRIAKCNARKKEIEIEGIKNKVRTEIDDLDIEIKEVELEQLNRARLGALREFKALFDIWRKFEHKFTRQELDADQEEYWVKRLTRQANNDVQASGRISVGNLDALRMIGKSSVPQLDVVRDVEKRYLEEGKSRILIAVPTELKAEKGLDCLKDITFPTSSECKILNVWGRKIDDAYNYAAMQACQDNADWLITIEDDTFAPKDVIIKLLELARKNKNCAIGAWYPKREFPRQGVHIIIKDDERQFLKDDGDIHEVQTLAMGCSIYPVSMFLTIPQPWFATTANLSQDSFFSQLAREYSYKLLVDTNIRCKHIDRVTGEVFE